MRKFGFRPIFSGTLPCLLRGFVLRLHIDVQTLRSQALKASAILRLQEARCLPLSAWVSYEDSVDVNIPDLINFARQ